MKKITAAGLLVLGIALAGCGGGGHDGGHEGAGAGAGAAAGAGAGAGAGAQDEGCTGGFEGWWNSVPANGDTSGLPEETVTVDTATGRTIDAFNRARNDAGEVTEISDVSYDPVRDDTWPADSAVVIDTATGKVIEAIPVEPGTQFCG